MNKYINQINDLIKTSKRIPKKDRDSLDDLLQRLHMQLDELAKENKEQAKTLAHLTRNKIFSQDSQEQHHILEDPLIEFESTHVELVKTINLICHSLSNLGV